MAVAAVWKSDVREIPVQWDIAAMELIMVP